MRKRCGAGVTSSCLCWTIFSRPKVSRRPIPAEQRTRLMECTSAGRRLLDVSKLSALEFVQTSSNIPSYRLASCSSMDSAKWIFVARLWTPHSGTTRQPSQSADVSWRISRPRASPCFRSDGEWWGNPPEHCSAQNPCGKWKSNSVETTDGSVFRARHFVGSALNPVQTFIELLDAGHFPSRVERKSRELSVQPSCATLRPKRQSEQPPHIWRGTSPGAESGIHDHSGA